MNLLPQALQNLLENRRATGVERATHTGSCNLTSDCQLHRTSVTRDLGGPGLHGSGVCVARGGALSGHDGCACGGFGRSSFAVGRAAWAVCKWTVVRVCVCVCVAGLCWPDYGVLRFPRLLSCSTSKVQTQELRHGQVGAHSQKRSRWQIPEMQSLMGLARLSRSPER